MNNLIYLYSETIFWLGRAPATDWHANPVDTISTNMDDDFLCHGIDNGKNSLERTMYFPGGMQRKTEYSEDHLVASFMFPKNWRLATLLRNKLSWTKGGGRIGTDLDNVDEWCEILRWAVLSQPSAECLEDRLHDYLAVPNHLNLFQSEEGCPDKRVAEIKQNIISELLWGEADHDICGISKQHARRLFGKETGTNLIRYKAHMRMLLQVAYQASGFDLTTSTNGAGFYDLSHSNRVHKSLYGVSQAKTFSACDFRVHQSVQFERLIEQRQLVAS